MIEVGGQFGGAQFSKHVGSIGVRHGERQQIAISGIDPTYNYSKAEGPAIYARMTRRVGTTWLHADGPDAEREHQERLQEHRSNTSYRKDLGLPPLSAPGHTQGTLFGASKSTPWKVGEMYSHPDMAGHALTVSHMLADHSEKTSGKPPLASDDLSAYSQKFVSRLAKLGLVEDPNEGNPNDNGMDFDSGSTLAASEAIPLVVGADAGVKGYSTIPEHEVNEHSDKVRARVRKASAAMKRQASAPQTQAATQPSLFKGTAYE